MAFFQLDRSVRRPQALIAPHILVTLAEYRADESDTLPDALTRFCNWCIQEAWLVREEVQPDAWPIFHASFYVAQVTNGGHGQFAANSALKLEILCDIEIGLERLGLNELLSIFRQFRNALDHDGALRAATMKGGGFGEIPTTIRKLDDDFFASPDPKRFNHQATNWLRSSPTVLPLTPHALRERQAAIVASNRLLNQRRAAASLRSPWSALTDAIGWLWDKTSLPRPGETALEETRRRYAAHRPREWQVGDIHRELILGLPLAVQYEDHEQVDRIFAGFRDLHARYGLRKTDSWATYIRMYGAKLQYAGERLGRADLLEKAADAFGQTIATGRVYEFDPGFDWWSLGQSLVELARLDQSQVGGLDEALDAFTNAFSLTDPQRPLRHGSRGLSLLGRAEAHLLLAAAGGGAGHLEAAREALAEQRPSSRSDNRKRWEAVNAELISLLPRSQVRAAQRDRALRQLDAAISWETDNEGDDGANRSRLKRLKRLRATLAEADRVPS